MSKKLRVIVQGILGRTPYAGVAWQALHYVEGFRRLGHDVYYVEDTGGWQFDADRCTVTDDCTYTIKYIARAMEYCGLNDRWACRTGPKGRTYGVSESVVKTLFETADAVVNVTGSVEVTNEYMKVPARLYLETDPGMAQIEAAKGAKFTVEYLEAHTHHFTYAENIGAADCGLPTGHVRYWPTRQPVVIDWWDSAVSQLAVERPFTTVSSWETRENDKRDMEWKGEVYTWSKHHQFLKFIDLPQRSPQPVELALACDDTAVIDMLGSHGWRVVDAIPLSKDILPYRDFIQGSRGEFTVAKDQNVRLCTGWFSDRSATYLAAGRPVITQETGFSKIFPTGLGLFAFETMDDVLSAMDKIASDYPASCRVAREIAVEYFAAEKVIGCLIAQAGL
jgi:hypothetical protein